MKKVERSVAHIAARRLGNRSPTGGDCHAETCRRKQLSDIDLHRTGPFYYIKMDTLAGTRTATTDQSVTGCSCWPFLRKP